MNSDEKEQSRSVEEETLLVEIAAIVDERRQWKEQADEFKKDAKRLRAEARKFVKEAKEKERRRQEVKEKINTDPRLTRLRRLRYDLLLLRLKRNDPAAAVVHANKFPRGHGEELSLALLHNTMVTTLDLDISHFLPLEGYLPSKGKPLLEFLAQSPSLVNLRVASGLGYGRPSSYARSESDAILKMISKSKNIQKLSWYLPVSSQAFHDLMKNSKTLRELNVDFTEHFHSYSDEDDELIISGFAADHAKLESLTLSLGESEHLVIGILENLQHVPSMKKLALIGQGHRDDDESYSNIFDAAAGYLQSTCKLERLELDSFCLTDSLMRIVLEGLTHSGDATGTMVPSVFVQQLAFPCCDVRKEAFERLVTFLQTETTSLDGHVTYQSCLRELTIELGLDDDVMDMDDDIMDMDNDTMLYAHAEQFAASLLAASCVGRSGLLLPTVGSQICTLRMDNVEVLFLEHLADNADRVRLRNLQLYGVEDDAAEVLPKVLPKLTSIQELTVNDIDSRRAARRIIKALKRSGSVLSVSTSGGYGDPTTTGGLHRPLVPCTDDDDEFDCGFNSTELRLIQAYCDRNRFFGALFANEEREEYMHDTESMTDAAILDSSEPVEVDAIQYPALFKVAMQVPAKLPRSLLKFGGDVGPDLA